MDENNPPRASRNHHGSSSSSSSTSGSSDHRGECHTSSTGSTTTPARKSRYGYAVDDGAGDRIECTGRFCKSCSGALIADCVALCCCPCALVNFLTLAFVKVPWMVGRKCLGLGKKKGQKREKRRKCKGGRSSKRGIEWVVERGEEEGKVPEISWRGGDGEEEMECDSARQEAERMWLELYQIGHLGFGRVSFTGIQSLGNKGQLGNVN
ncbi:hypothetical protein ACFX1Z_044427 [Malus domestica]